MAFRYGVPLKGGNTIEAVALSPYVDTAGPDACIRAGYERAMASTRLDVQIKRQNTLRFLDHVERNRP